MMSLGDDDDDVDDFFSTGNTGSSGLGSSGPTAPWASSGGSFGGGPDPFSSSGAALGGTLGSLLNADADFKRGHHMSLGRDTVTKQDIDRQIEEKRKAEEAAKERAATSALFASAIQLMQYDANNTAHILPGDFVTAILFNSIHNAYSFVTYRDANGSQQIITTLTAPFTIIVQANLYVQFFDANKRFWCMKFDSQDSVDEFAQHIACVNHQLQVSANTFTSTIVQELTPGDANEPAASAGDKAKVKYQMCLLSNEHPKGLGTVVGRVGFSKADIVKIGDGKTLKGIDDALVGMRKGQRRFLIIPAHFAYGATASASIPANSVLTVVLTVSSVKPKGSKPKREKAPEGATESSSQPQSPAPAATSPGTRQKRTPSLSERMAKMGVSMMPPVQQDDEKATTDSPTSSALVPVTEPEPPVVEPESQPVAVAPSMPPQQVALAQPQQPQPSSQAHMNQGGQSGPPGYHSSYNQPYNAQQQQRFQQQSPMQQPTVGQQFPQQGYHTQQHSTSPNQFGFAQSNPPYGQGPAATSQFGGFNPNANNIPGGFGAQGGGAPNLQQLAAQLQQIHTNVTQLVALHQGNFSQNTFEQHLSPAQVLTAMNRLVKERDAAVIEAKEKSEQAQSSAAKVESYIEKNEVLMRENASLTQQRYSSLQTASSEHLQQYNTLAQEKQRIELALAQKSMELERAKFESERAVQQQTLSLQTELHRVRSTAEHERNEAVQQALLQHTQKTNEEISKIQADANAMLTTMRTSLAEREQQASEQKAHQARLEETLATEQTKLAALQATFDKAVASEQALTSQLAQAQTNFEQSTQQLSDSAQRDSQHQEQLAALQQQLASLTETHATAQREAAALHTETQKEAASLREQAEQLRGALNEHQASQGAEQGASNSKIAALQADLDGALAQNAELKTEIAELKTEIQEMITGVEKLKASKARTTKSALERIAQVEKEAEESKASIVEQSRAVISKLRTELAAAREQGGSADDSAQAVKLTMRQVYNQLKSAFNDEETYEKEFIQTTLMGVIRRVTMAQLQDGEEEEEEEEGEEVDEEEADEGEADEGEADEDKEAE
jgi:FK506-binding protein 15